MVSASAEPGLSFVPRDVLSAMEKIHRAGFGVWLVGGALRDYFLGIAPKDWDLATSAGSSEIISLFPAVIPVGIRHGTVQVHTRTRDIEVTSFAPGNGGIAADLARRDFTINSIALSYPDGLLLDPNAGREDLRAGIVRGVGEPRARFLEDPLRIVRAARICGIFGFRIEPATFEAMRAESGRLGEISGERVRDEILKILLSPNVSVAFGLLRESGAFAGLLPFLEAGARMEFREGTGISLFDHTLSCILNCPERLRVRLAALFHESALPFEEGDTASRSALLAVKTLRAWNVSNRQTAEVSTLVARQISEDALFWSDAQIRRFITEIGRELLEDSIALAQAQMLSGGWTHVGRAQLERLFSSLKSQLGRISAFSVRELALGGQDVMKILALRPGPRVGEILGELFDLVQEDPGLNTRENLTRLVEETFRKSPSGT
ncbi:MAG: CCA tRNA nucleotidyltransferase [Syntrophobacteraceae bacterium]